MADKKTELTITEECQVELALTNRILQLQDKQELLDDDSIYAYDIAECQRALEFFQNQDHGWRKANV